MPERQQLLRFKNYHVYYAAADQIPNVMAEIATERERVFRAYDEGSGQSLDTDDFDATYVQLFVWDSTNTSLVGAYRMGRTDEILSDIGPTGLYLSQMFEFDRGFHDPAVPALELGRSFVVPEHQRSFHALYLLWQGIGRYLAAHPRYRRLYGTVSLSRQYDDRAMAMLCNALIRPDASVRPKHPLTTPLHPEWLDYRSAHEAFSLDDISAFVRGLDCDGKDVPVLLRHYHKLGARFLAVGVDPNFNDTPGLLLSVDIASLPTKTLATFLGANAPEYLQHVVDQP